MIRSIALRKSDPSSILAEFNTAFSKAVGNPYLFVSMFVGVLDTGTFRLEYGSTGHDCAFVRRKGGVQQLSVTGPVLGVMEEPFATEMIDLEPGDTLVLATDGLTEVRNRAGAQLLEQGAMELIGRASPHAQQLADGLVAQVRARGGKRVRDDLAVLAIRVVDAEPAPGLGRARAHPLMPRHGSARSRGLQSSSRRSRGSLQHDRRSVGADLGFARALTRVSRRIVRRGAGDASPRAARRAGNARNGGFVRCELRGIPDLSLARRRHRSGSFDRPATRHHALGARYGRAAAASETLVSTLGSCPAKTRSRPSGSRTRSIAMP